MHINFLFLVSTPSVMHRNYTVAFLALQFFSLEEFCLLVTIAEEKSHGSALFAVNLSLLSVLNHGTHWSYTCSQSYHHLRLVLSFRDVHSPIIHFGHYLSLCSIVPEEVGGHAVSLVVICVVPVVLDDAEFYLVTHQSVSGGNGVESRLDLRHVVHEVLHRGHGRGEFLQEVCLGGLLLVSHILQLNIPFLSQQVL